MRQATTPQPTPAPGVPRTAQELQAISHKRSELGDQLRTITERRRVLLEQMVQTDPSARGEMQVRMKTLDARAARLETEILAADDAIASALAAGVGAMPPEPPPRPGIVVQPGPPVFVGGRDMAVLAVGEALVLALLGFVLWRLAWKRAMARVIPAADHSRRFDQLQQSVDVIALEVERISEGQRYMAKVLNEKPALGAGDAQPIAGREKNPLAARASDER